MTRLKDIITRHDLERIDQGEHIVYLHKATKLRFVAVPSGTFQFGISDRDLATANEIDPKCFLESYALDFFPARTVSQQKTLLVSQTPIIDCNLVEAGYGPELLVDPNYHNILSEIDFATAFEFCAKYGFRLPTELEWEYCVRAGSDTLLVWGNALPSRKELEAWMDTDSANINEAPSNQFGLKYLFNGEGCSDLFVSPGRETRPSPGNHVVKCGGARLWPWQSNDWIFCIPHYRMESASFEEQKFSFRVVIDVLDEDQL